MLLQPLRQCHGLVVVEILHTVTQLLVIFLFNEQIVDRIVHSTLVLRLHVEQERLDQRDVVRLLEHPHHAVHVDARCQCLQQVGDQRWLFLQIEVQGAVVDLQVGHLDDGLLEALMLPRVRRPLHHGQRGIVILVVVGVQEDELRPQMRFLARCDELGNVDSAPEDAEVLHHTFWMIFAECDTQ